MTYKKYMEKYHYGFGHEDYECGERMLLSLEELLVELKDGGYACPDEVDGGIPVKIAIYPEDAIDAIEQQLYDYDFSDEDYEVPEVGKEFLRKCFQEYNEKYANYGNYCDTVTVEVPDEMKYELARNEGEE